MNIEDLMINFELEGALRIQKWNDEIADNEILFETYDIRYGDGIPYDIIIKEIAYMYATTTELGATLIIEIAEEYI